MNEITLINEDGEKMTFANMVPAALEKTDNESLEELGYMAKILKARFKDIDAEIKKRLEDGQQFGRVEYVERNKKMIPQDDNDLKQQFIFKYGYDAVELKSPMQLRKQFGKAIEEDLEAITIFDMTNAVKWN
ncbi:hypothetical protein ACX9YQ_07525 [Weissella cibaria]